MDGLNRKEVSYPTIRVHRTEEQARRDDYLSQDTTTRSTPTSSTPTISTNTNNQYKYNNHAYIVSGKDVLRNWARSGAAIILLPDKLVSWRDKSIRILADEIAFATQAVVIIPDIYRSSVEDNSESCMNISSHCTDEHADTATTTISTTMFDDIIATIQFIRTEYSAGTVSFAGIGYGAGVALEASCILHDIGRMVQYIDIQHQLRDTGNASQGTGTDPAGNVHRDSENGHRDPGNDTIEALTIENALSDPNSTEYKVLYRVFNTDRNIFPRVDITNSIQSLQSTAVAVDSTTIPMQSAVPSRSGSSSSDSSTITSSSSDDSSCSSSDGSRVQEEDLDTILYEDFDTIVDISNRHGSERDSSSAERAKKEDSSSGSQDSTRSGSTSTSSSSNNNNVSSVSNSMNIYTFNL